MRYLDMPIAQVRPDDHPAVIHELGLLVASGIDVRRPPGNRYHLKVSPGTNYYPTTGLILKDGQVAPLPVRGLDALLNHLRDMGSARTVRSQA